MADVWVAESPGKSSDDTYTTVEVFFAVNSLSVSSNTDAMRLPLGVIRYEADSQTASYFRDQYVSHYVNTHSISTDQSLDVSHCFSLKDILHL